MCIEAKNKYVCIYEELGQAKQDEHKKRKKSAI